MKNIIKQHVIPCIYKLLPDCISWIITRARMVVVLIIWLHKLIHSYSHTLLGVITHSVEFLVWGKHYIHSIIIQLSCSITMSWPSSHQMMKLSLLCDMYTTIAIPALLSPHIPLTGGPSLSLPGASSCAFSYSVQNTLYCTHNTILYTLLHCTQDCTVYNTLFWTILYFTQRYTVINGIQ